MLKLRLPALLSALALMLPLNPALAAEPAPVCASLDDCMIKGQESESIDSALAFFSKGIGLWKKGDSSEDLALATLIRGQTYISYYSQSQDKQHLDAAEKDFTRVTELKPKSYEGFVGLAIVAANRGKFDDTENFFKQAIAADPQNPLGYQERASFYFATENYQGTVADITTAIGMLSGKSYDEASKTYKITTGVDLPNEQRVMMYVLRAQAYLKLGRESEGHADLDKACELGETRACR